MLIQHSSAADKRTLQSLWRSCGQRLVLLSRHSRVPISFLTLGEINSSANIAPPSLSGRRAQPVPGVTHLMVVYFRQVIRRVERQRLDVEPADRAEQGVGGDHAIALRADQPCLRGNQVLLRVQHVDRGALAALRLLLHALDSEAATAILAPSLATHAPVAAVRA